jgi:hypothetical protein
LASIWEIQIKVALGKLDLKGDLATILDIQIEENSIQLLSIELKHIYALSNLPVHHRDPFDRLLITQSQVKKMTLATVDGAFVGKASPWRIDMRSTLFQRRYANGSSQILMLIILVLLRIRSIYYNSSIFTKPPSVN